ncbi:MAG: putative enoyl-CoA hydratase 1 [Pseudomonadales bacterium]|jgi:acyl dehydratase|nr:putative enoyl-CoA hydratase 1 [Pseudomonadales bacterium]
MKQYRFDDVEALQELVSPDFGAWSAELEITQELIDRFADLSGDDYWIHTDPERCKTQSPFGTTIAHGFLTLALLPKMKQQPTYELTGYNNILNYGSDKLRFTGAVPVGSRIHSRSRVKSVERLPKGTRLTIETNVHVVGQERPALVYELVAIYM